MIVMDETKIVIYADERESRNSGDTVVKILGKKEGCDLKLQRLEIADFQLSKRCGVERKTVGDFLQSLIDGRLFSQLKDLKKIFARPLLLIEGEEDIYSERQIRPEAINGALASIAIDMQIPILWTKSPHETAELLFLIAKREQIEKKKSVQLRERPKLKSLNQEQEFLLAGLPGISALKAKSLLKHFGTPAGIFAAGEKELAEAEGIGKILARRIHGLLGRKYEKSILEE
jgi:Fanconi anemia group M protein